jgi:hypothetical protein
MAGPLSGDGLRISAFFAVSIIRDRIEITKEKPFREGVKFFTCIIFLDV